MTAAETMSVALIEMTDAQQRPPCAHSSDAWMSNVAAQRAAAARACQSCPLLDLCADLADEMHVRFGVWGGKDRTPRPRKPRTTVSDDLMHHAPGCPQPGTTTEPAHSVTVTRCLGCHAVTTTRNTPQTTGPSRPTDRSNHR